MQRKIIYKLIDFDSYLTHGMWRWKEEALPPQAPVDAGISTDIEASDAELLEDLYSNPDSEIKSANQEWLVSTVSIDERLEILDQFSKWLNRSLEKEKVKPKAKEKTPPEAPTDVDIRSSFKR